MRSLSRVGIAVVVLGLGVTPVSAQISAEGSIRGVVKDAQGGELPGVTLTATSPSAAVRVTTLSGERGGYRFVSLTPGDYTITAELSGFAKYERKGVAVRAGRNIALDIALQLGSFEETVEVTGEAPLLEVQQATTSVNIAGDLQRSLPLSSRGQFADFLEVTPGIVGRAGDATGGGQIYFLRGGELENHVVQLDGADMGSFRQNRADRNLTMNTDAIGDVQVKTAAIDASAPLGSGAVINVATKSGTDEFHGGLGILFTPESWNGDNAGTGDVRFNEIIQPDVSLSGPIVPGKAWFFGGYRYTRQFSGISRTASQIATLSALQPGFEPFDNSVLSHNFYLKATVQLSEKHQLYAFWEKDDHPEDGNREIYAIPLQANRVGGSGYAARLQSIWGSSVTTRVLLSYNDKTTGGEVFDYLVHDGPQRPVHAEAFVSSGRLQGSGVIAYLDNWSEFGTSPSSKTTFQADLTYFKPGFLGDHEFQTGVLVQSLKNEENTLYPNGGFAIEEVVLNDAANPGGGYVPFHRRVYDVASLTESRTAATDFAIYVQDAWRPTARLTVNLGVRLDWIKGTEEVFDTQLQDAWHVGPRLGATWVVTEDGKNIVRGSFGRIHEMPMPRNLGSVGAASAGYTDLYDNNLDGNFETELVRPGATAARSDRVIDPDHHQPYIDEWTLGYRRQLPGGVSVDAGFTRRSYKDIPALVETNGIYDGGVFQGYQNEDLNQIYLVTNNQWNHFVYSGLDVNAAKRISWLQLIAGYTRGWQHLAGTWQPNDPASFIQPDAFPNNRGIGSIRGNVTDSLSRTADTRSPSWIKHNFRVGATVNTSWGLDAAVNYVYLSGAYSGSIQTRIAAADPQFGPSRIRLSNGRTVSNPLATTIRWVGPTRGDGQLALEALQFLNLRLGYTLKLGGDQRVQTALDIFNVTNQGAFEQWENGSNQVFSANYGVGRARQFPRVFQVSVRYQF